MADTKATIAEAAIAAGLCTIDEAESMTKQQLLDLWSEEGE